MDIETVAEELARTGSALAIFEIVLVAVLLATIKSEIFKRYIVWLTIGRAILIAALVY